MKVTSSLAVLASVGLSEAFWRMECRGRVGLARLDPIVAPGRASQHAHAIFGSNGEFIFLLTAISGFSMNAGHAELRAGSCTSCAALEDKSAYWSPQMYFKHEDGTFEEVTQAGGMLAYYLLNKDAGNPDKGVKAFPNGFRMVAGDSNRRNYSIGTRNYMDADPEKSLWAMLGETSQEDLAQRAVGFNCLDYNKKPEGALVRHYLPEKGYLDGNCPDGIRLELMFPSCWNGKDLDSANHRSHVAYPDLVTDGWCPKGFDTKLPSLMFEIIYETNKFNGIPGEFSLTVVGFGFHGDFASGWDQEFLQDAVDTCTDPSGLLTACPLFTLQSEDEQRQCKIELPEILATEKVTGKCGASLPGNVPIRYGPAPANAQQPGADQTSHVPVPTVTYQPADSSAYQPGGIFNGDAPSSTSSSSSEEVKVTALAQPEPEPEPTPTLTPTPSEAPIPSGYELVRTEYVTNGRVVSKIVVIETVEYVMLAAATEVETVTVTATLGAQKARRELNHLHRHRHGSH
ncbi:hypothetical protein B0T21DRAFT_284510 [Apiosordaria backusii]|uniref:DUF1996 domain-containing protein n=1 Tax=Apiosordaria backusii TaxID=314023 RepID=A0AA40BSL2_9PEZI|nr:hypothetical protein B0T21DRAFT_284510 [Apiosordaria backusii]